MKVIAFAASNSKKSINKELVSFAVTLLPSNVNVEVLDLNNYELPIFSEDKEVELGKPELAQAFYDKISQADGIIISFAEHNGTYTVAFKNLFDWVSRINQKLYQNKPVVFLATSPGKGGASNVLKQAESSAPYFAAQVKGSLSIPSFYDVFDLTKKELNDETLKNELTVVVNNVVENN